MHTEWRVTEWFGWERTSEPPTPAMGAEIPLPVIAGPIPQLLPRPQSRIPEPVPVPGSALADEKSSEGSD